MRTSRTAAGSLALQPARRRRPSRCATGSFSRDRLRAGSYKRPDDHRNPRANSRNQFYGRFRRSLQFYGLPQPINKAATASTVKTPAATRPIRTSSSRITFPTKSGSSGGVASWSRLVTLCKALRHTKLDGSEATIQMPVERQGSSGIVEQGLLPKFNVRSFTFVRRADARKAEGRFGALGYSARSRSPRSALVAPGDALGPTRPELGMIARLHCFSEAPPRAMPSGRSCPRWWCSSVEQSRPDARPK